MTLDTPTPSPATDDGPEPARGTELPGVTAVYYADVRQDAPEVDPAATASAMHYEYTRIGGRTGQSFFRCVRCRALIEERLREQELHTQWHAESGDPLDTPAAQSGWGSSA